MQYSVHLTNKERRRRQRRIWRASYAISILAHLLLFVLWRGSSDPESPFAAAGPRNNDDRAAGGSLHALNIQVPEPVRLTPPEVPLPIVAEIEPPEFEEDRQIASVLGERPGDEGPGLENGEGEGDGGTSEEGLFRLVPPQPRGMIIPPANESLRGREVEVWVFVNERGRVVADSTHLRPPTPDRSFNRRLIEESADWVFRPAMKGGEPVAAWFPYKISM